MKVNQILIYIGIIISFSSSAQNWDVFNKNYRYNYIYNNNTLVTNVLFTDSIKQIGADTAYYMNRIGLECMGTCPTLTVPITASLPVIVNNIPQFLQRSIIKYANGLVMLNDTAKLVIKSSCSIGETWLFDTINNKTAQCIGISTPSLFAVSDSVKTILIDGTDTLKLSKQFGIIQFPDLYNKNKYYRLVGVENASSYDQTALFGYKVPNAWDFYNFDVGDKFCREQTYSYGHSMAYTFGTRSINRIILSKTLVPNIGYNYDILENKRDYLASGPSTPTTIYTYTTITVSLNFSSDYYYSRANKIYPAKVMYGSSGNNNIAKFGKDNNGKFYKYFGPPCQTYNNVVMPNLNSAIGYQDWPNNYYGYAYLSSSWGEGLGMLSDLYTISGYSNHDCLSCALKNGSLYLGEESFVGIDEKNKKEDDVIIYPNPTNGELIIDTKENTLTKVEINNYLGQSIFIRNINETITKLDLIDYPNGIYFLKIYNKEGQTVVKKLIKN